MNLSKCSPKRISLPVMLAAVIMLFADVSFGQSVQAGPFRLGERITYTVSLDKFKNVAYAETFVVSQGRLGDKDAVEIRGRIKTLDFVSAAFYMIDETRTTFASAETGLPLYIQKNQNTGGLPQETVHNYLTVPNQNTDLLTLVYKIRAGSGTGASTLQENDKVYGVTFQSTVAERVKTDAGEYDTNISTVQSDYFTELGIRDVRINLSSDEHRIPVLIRFKTEKGEFRASISGVRIELPETPAAEAGPVPVITPRPELSPKPQPTPTPYIDNMPLAPELAFELGETLNYQVTMGPMPVGTVSLQAKERKLFNGVDSLLLEARVTTVQPGNPVLAVNETITAQVSPETLAPQHVDVRMPRLLGPPNTIRFDKSGSLISFSGGTPVSAPVGTQSILSLLYAMRSFNLKPSLDSKNPVNDTRVAVFWDKQPYVFTLRPSAPDFITVRGARVSSQLVTISTNNETLDRLQIKVWLSNDASRKPLRISAGNYQADLISESRIQFR